MHIPHNRLAFTIANWPMLHMSGDFAGTTNLKHGELECYLYIWCARKRSTEYTPENQHGTQRCRFGRCFFFKQVIFRVHVNLPQCNSNIEDDSTRHIQHSGMYTSLQHPCHPGVPPCPPALTTCTFSLSNTKVVETKKSALNLLWLVSVSMFKSQTKK